MIRTTSILVVNYMIQSLCAGVFFGLWQASVPAGCFMGIICLTTWMVIADFKREKP